jgi:hypothetical protein
MPGKVNPAVETGKSVNEVVEDEKAESGDGEK